MKKTIFYTDQFIKNNFDKLFTEKRTKNIEFVEGTAQENNLTEKELDNIYKNTEILSAHVSSKLDKEFLKKFKKLKMIAVYSTGVDHIDLKFCIKKKIEVKNVKNYGAHSVAQHNIAMMFNVSSRLCMSNYFLKKQKKFLVDNRPEIRGFELRNKKIGIFGTGAIGKEIIKMLRALDVEVIASDIYPDNDFAKKYNFKYVNFDVLLKESDIFSINIPLTKETKNIISEKIFQKMKNGIIIINTSRGGIINPGPLLKNLKNKKVSFACLDVMENELDIYNTEFPTNGQKKTAEINREIIDMENVIVTPHNAYNTDKAVKTVVFETVKNIIDFENNNNNN